MTLTLTADVVATAVESTGLGVVRECWHLDSGWESTIWAVRTSEHRLAVRVYASAIRGDAAAREARAMKALASAGYPVPRVHAVDSTLSLLGRPFLVMDLIDGRTLWSQRPRTLDEVAQLCADLMAKLHGLDPRQFEVPPLDRAALLKALAGYVVRIPFLVGVAEWLEERLETRDPAPCHMDFHPGNILIDRAGNHSVIDWTSFALSDPRLDTGWTRLLGEMYGPPGFAQAFEAAYETATRMPAADPVLDVLVAARRIGDVVWFLGPEGSQEVTAEAGIATDVESLGVAAAWIERGAGLRIAELDAILRG